MNMHENRSGVAPLCNLSTYRAAQVVPSSPGGPTPAAPSLPSPTACSEWCRTAITGLVPSLQLGCNHWDEDFAVGGGRRGLGTLSPLIVGGCSPKRAGRIPRASMRAWGFYASPGQKYNLMGIVVVCTLVEDLWTHRGSMQEHRIAFGCIVGFDTLSGQRSKVLACYRCRLRAIFSSELLSLLWRCGRSGFCSDCAVIRSLRSLWTAADSPAAAWSYHSWMPSGPGCLGSAAADPGSWSLGKWRADALSQTLWGDRKDLG